QDHPAERRGALHRNPLPHRYRQRARLFPPWRHPALCAAQPRGGVSAVHIDASATAAPRGRRLFCAATSSNAVFHPLLTRQGHEGRLTTVAMPAKRAPGLVLGLAILAFAAPAARADSVPVPPRAVVELFTSQGCAQCPPADALLTGLAERGDVVALAYHVDYWDYIGWQDTFGDQAFSDRQRAYAKSWGSSRIYTPQMVVNGAKGVVGSRRDEVRRAIDGASLPLPVALRRDGGMLEVDIPGKADLGDATVWLVTFLDRAD